MNTGFSRLCAVASKSEHTQAERNQMFHSYLEARKVVPSNQDKNSAAETMRKIAAVWQDGKLDLKETVNSFNFPMGLWRELGGKTNPEIFMTPMELSKYQTCPLGYEPRFFRDDLGRPVYKCITEEEITARAFDSAMRKFCNNKKLCDDVGPEKGRPRTEWEEMLDTYINIRDISSLSPRQMDPSSAFVVRDGKITLDEALYTLGLPTSFWIELGGESRKVEPSTHSLVNFQLFCKFLVGGALECFALGTRPVTQSDFLGAVIKYCGGLRDVIKE